MCVCVCVFLYIGSCVFDCVLGGLCAYVIVFVFVCFCIWCVWDCV